MDDTFLKGQKSLLSEYRNTPNPATADIL